MKAIQDKPCSKPECENFGKRGIAIGRHGWFTTKTGRRRRYRCKICGGTLSTNTGTAYSGLRCTRKEFDQVAGMRVEGVSISATARLTGRSRNTVARWLERASRAAELFNRRMLRDFDIVELQADELYTFIGGKSRPMWLFATIEVCSRLWASSLVGRRSYRNTKAVLNDVILRGRLVGIPLIATDGLLRGDRSPHGYRLRLRSSDQDSAEQWCRPSRTARQDRHDESLGGSTVGVGGFREPERAHTSFVERLNLTIRQGSAYLRRRSPCHARCADRLRWHVELLRCHYNFVRPHSALKFGRETRTPAMQAGLVSTPMNWNDIFTAHGLSLRIFATVVRIPVPVQLIETGVAELPTFSWPHDQRKAA